MDIVHHAAIGGIAMAAMASVGHEIAGAAFLAGSVLPDLDVFFMAGGKRAYLRNHQGLTHSLLVAPLIALLISFPIFSITDISLIVFVAALCGVLLHILLDWNNTFGIALLWPLRKTRFCCNAVFFVDLFLWCLTLIVAGLMYFIPGISIAIAYFGIFAAYLLFKSRLHRAVQSSLACKYATPSSLNPFAFYILHESSNGVETYLYDWLREKKRGARVYPTPLKKYEDLANRSQVYRDIRGVTKFLYITDVIDDADKTIITAKDLAIRNYGGKFGRTMVRFDSSGQLQEEEVSI